MHIVLDIVPRNLPVRVARAEFARVYGFQPSTRFRTRESLRLIPVFVVRNSAVFVLKIIPYAQLARSDLEGFNGAFPDGNWAGGTVSRYFHYLVLFMVN